MINLACQIQALTRMPGDITYRYSMHICSISAKRTEICKPQSLGGFENRPSEMEKSELVRLTQQ